MQLGFIGTGEITSSIVTGLCSSRLEDHSIQLSPRNSTIATRLANRFPEISVASSNQNVLDHSDIVVIAVRPSVAREVLQQLRFRPDHEIISLVSALSLGDLASLVAPAGRIARAVPLPSAASRLSPTAIYPPNSMACELFSSVGTVFPVDNENQFNAFCATTATIASHLAFCESIASWLQNHAIAAPQARDYVARLFFGVMNGVAESPQLSFGALSATHATAGGINEQFLKHMTNHGALAKVSEGLDAVLRRINTQS